MSMHLKILALTLALTAFGTAGVQAQTTCREGRTADGKCVNPVLANVMRHSTIIATQPKISDTSALNLPSEDSYYRVTPHFFEYTNFYGRISTVPSAGYPPIARGMP